MHRLTPCWIVVIAFLLAPQAAAEDLFFDSDGVRIRYVDVGRRDRDPVVLVPGGAQSIEAAWGVTGIMRALQDDYRVIGVDLRGQGKSDKPHDPDAYGIEMAEDIGRLLNHLDVEQAHIVGYSMGARIANTFRSRYPWRIRTLTLGGYGWPWSRPPATLEEARAALENRNMPAGNDVDALAAYRARAHEHVPSKEAVQANWIPTLSIVGTEDTVVSREDVETLRATMPKVTAVDLPGTHAGADGLLYKPEFAAAVAEFIRANDRR